MQKWLTLGIYSFAVFKPRLNICQTFSRSRDNVRNKLLLPGYRKHSIHVRYSYSYSPSSVDMDFYRLVRVTKDRWCGRTERSLEEVECGVCV